MRRIFPDFFRINQMNALRPLKPNEPGVAYGVISGFPVHDSYPVEDREKLDKIFREDYFAWKAMSWAGISRFATNRSGAQAPIGASLFSHYRVNVGGNTKADESSTTGS